MASFKITFKQSVAKDLRRIPKKEVARILNLDPKEWKNSPVKRGIEFGKVFIELFMRSQTRN